MSLKEEDHALSDPALVICEQDPGQQKLNNSLSEDGEIPSTGSKTIVDSGNEEKKPQTSTPTPTQVPFDPPHNCIYIGRIPTNFDEEDLFKYFVEYGEIQYLSMAPFRRKSSGSTCFAHLQFRDKSAVVGVLAKPIHIVLGASLDVEMAKSVPKNVEKKRSSRRRRGNRGNGGNGLAKTNTSSSVGSRCESPQASRKVFIGGLRYTTTSDQLRHYFRTFGEIEEAMVMTDKSQGKSRGFGFVTFKNMDSVDRCQNSRPHSIDNQRVDTKRAIPREEMERDGFGGMTTSRLFVGELHPDVEEDDLRSYFTSFGEVRSVELIRDRVTGRKRGFAYIEFGDYDVVDKIVCRKHRILKRRINVEKALEPGALSLKKSKSLKRKRVPAPWSSSSSTEDLSGSFKDIIEEQRQAATAAAMAYCTQFVNAMAQGGRFDPAGNMSTPGSFFAPNTPYRAERQMCGGYPQPAQFNYPQPALNYPEDPKFSPESTPSSPPRETNSFGHQGSSWPPAVVTTLGGGHQRQGTVDYYTSKYYNDYSNPTITPAPIPPTAAARPSVIWEYTSYPKPTSTSMTDSNEVDSTNSLVELNDNRISFNHHSHGLPMTNPHVNYQT